MKKIKVSRISSDQDKAWQDADRNLLDQVPWPTAYPYHPKVSLAISHDGAHIYLNFRVQEQSIRAHTLLPNGEVWKDSCVEFFVSPGSDDHYYNFEFNCVGATRLSAGNSRHHRTRASDALINQINVTTSLEKGTFEEKFGDFEWELTAVIPLSCFFEHQIKQLDGQEFRANFYKCGDELSTPHFVTWNLIHTPNPDFHRPEFFGRLEFVD